MTKRTYLSIIASFGLLCACAEDELSPHRPPPVNLSDAGPDAHDGGSVALDGGSDFVLVDQSGDSGDSLSIDAGDAAGIDAFIPPPDVAHDGGATDSELSDGAPPGSSVCEQACAAVAAVDCPMQPECFALCLASLEGKCGEITRRLQACLAAKGPSDFACVDGRASPVAGVCAEEQEAVVLCLFS